MKKRKPQYKKLKQHERRIFKWPKDPEKRRALQNYQAMIRMRRLRGRRALARIAIEREEIIEEMTTAPEAPAEDYLAYLHYLDFDEGYQRTYNLPHVKPPKWMRKD